MNSFGKDYLGFYLSSLCPFHELEESCNNEIEREVILSLEECIDFVRNCSK
jgi:hypothetical protein